MYKYWTLECQLINNISEIRDRIETKRIRNAMN